MRTIITLLAFVPFVLSATIHNATEAYAAGDYETALSLYSETYADSSSAGLLYNIGNCHFKLNQVGKAILFYERAVKVAPGDEDVRGNLHLARQQVVDRIAELPSLEIGNYWNRFKAGSDVDQWARYSLFACLLAFALLAAMLFAKSGLRKILLVLGLAMIGFTAFCVVLAAAQKSDVLHGNEAIIMADRVEIMSTPGADGTKLFILHEGTKVTVLRNENEWNEIQLSNGSVGWVPASGIEVI